MLEIDTISCPRCGSGKFLFGTLRPRDSEDHFDGRFYPLHIKKKTFWSLTEPSVAFSKDEKTYACYECGHLWSKLNLEEFKLVVAKCGWQGGKQIVPNPPKEYFMLVSSIIIGVLLLLIAFFKFYT